MNKVVLPGVRCLSHPHVSSAAQMLQLQRCLPRALSTGIAGLWIAMPSQPLPGCCSLRPVPAPGPLCTELVQPPSFLRPRGPCACGCCCGCGCGGLHTEEDKAFVEFLGDEIKEEKKI